MDAFLKRIAGAQDLFDWFGFWPSFHDAEVLTMEFNRTGSSRIRVHTFRITGQADSQGHFICDKHCIVTFWLDEITDVELAHFNNQNAIVGLRLSNEDGQYAMSFDLAHGVEGVVIAKQLAIEIAPGVPEDSQYKGP